MENKGPIYSDKEAERIGNLIAGFIRDTLTTGQRHELDDWLEKSEDNMQLFLKLTDEQNVDAAMKWMEGINTEKALAQKKKNISFNKRLPIESRFKFWPYIAAASVIIIAGIFFIKHLSKQEHTPDIVKSPIHDLTPGTNKATLTLEDGKIIALDNSSPDTSLNGRVNIFKKQGEIYYKDSSVLTNELTYNTLNIPKGGQYKLVLPDGTKVWLNAASSIRYPVAFNSKERKVFVKGETYFEVAKDKSKPFRVVADDMTVEALGTKFNVKAYEGEPGQSATLVEGSVLVTKGNNSNILKPGQQAQTTSNNFSISDVLTEDVVAWKDNLFKFTDAPLDVIMRDVERWYDAEVVYETGSTEQFTATVSRDLPVSKLLHILELTKRVHFRIENKKITVIK